MYFLCVFSVNLREINYWLHREIQEQTQRTTEKIGVLIRAFVAEKHITTKHTKFFTKGTKKHRVNRTLTL